jgi:hypothetical protein
MLGVHYGTYCQYRTVMTAEVSILCLINDQFTCVKGTAVQIILDWQDSGTTSCYSSFFHIFHVIFPYLDAAP